MRAGRKYDPHGRIARLEHRAADIFPQSCDDGVVVKTDAKIRLLGIETEVEQNVPSILDP
jgi:hypothetical protein